MFKGVRAMLREELPPHVRFLALIMMGLFVLLILSNVLGQREIVANAQAQKPLSVSLPENVIFVEIGDIAGRRERIAGAVRSESFSHHIRSISFVESRDGLRENSFLLLVVEPKLSSEK